MKLAEAARLGQDKIDHFLQTDSKFYKSRSPLVVLLTARVDCSVREFKL
jgi:hypothetical protein